VNAEGHVAVHPSRDPKHGLDLFKLALDLEAQGVRLPLLVRFSDILKSRLELLAEAFATAIKEFGYEGNYTTVYPIKVNQQRHVVQEIVEFGTPLGVGLEFDFSERRFVLIYILLQNIEQSLCLLRAEVDALKIVNRDVVRCRLIDAAEHEEEVPKIDSDLYAVGIILAVFGGVDQLNLGCCRLSHRLQGTTRPIGVFRTIGFLSPLGRWQSSL